MAPQLEGVNSMYAGIMGSGKTFAVTHNTRKYDRIIAYDQSGFLWEEVTRFGGEITSDPARVADLLNQATVEGVGFRIGFVDQAAQFKTWIMEQVDKLTEPPLPGKRPAFPVAFWTEEAALVFDQAGMAEVQHPIMMKLLRGSRHRRMHLIFSTQRPQDLPRKMRDLLNDIWIFQLPDDEPAEIAAKKLGDRKLTPTIQVLKNGFHFHRDDRGKRTGPKRIRAA